MNKITQNPQWKVGTTANSITNRNAGNVGIGTTSPNAKLTVNGDINFTTDDSATARIITVNDQTTVSTASSNLTLKGGKGLGANIGGILYLTGGLGGATGTGGRIAITGGAGGGGNAWGGNVAIMGGAKSGAGGEGLVLLGSGRSGTDVQIVGPSQDHRAILSAASIASTDKTFTFPNLTGTLALLENSQTVTGAKTFGSVGAVGKLILAGNTSGTTILDAAAVAGATTITLPGATTTLVGTDTTDTLTNKTLTSPVINTGVSGTAIASGAEVTTGTNDTKIVTPLAAQALGGADGWISAAETWTYASASTITIPAGGAAKYAVGDRIKFTQTTVKYGVITVVADTLLTIAVNTTYTVANAAISANYYSHEASPIGYPSGISVNSKIIEATRNLTAASGDVAYTGAGFTPTAMIVLGTISGAATPNFIAIVDSSKTNKIIVNLADTGTKNYASNYVVETEGASGNYQIAIVKTFDADGFTLTWTKAGAPTGTLTLFFLCFR